MRQEKNFKKETKKEMKKLTTVVLFVVLSVFIAMPVMAEHHLTPDPGTDITFYANVRVSTFYINKNNPSGTDDDSDFIVDLQPNSRIGAKFKRGSLFGHWEEGFGDTISNRLLYGVWTISDGMTLSIGKMYNPPYWWTNSAVLVDNAGIGYGAVYEGAQPQIKLNVKGFYVDVAKANTVDLITSATVKDTDIDTTLPKVFVGYGFNNKSLTLDGGLGFNTYNLKSATANFDDSISSWIVYGHGKANITDNDFINFSVAYEVNPNEFGILGMNGRTLDGLTSSSKVKAAVSGDKIEDTKTVEAFLEYGHKFGATAAYVGYGYASSDNDTWAKSDAHQEYWVNAIIPLWTEEKFLNLTVTPEIHVFDEMKDNAGNTQPAHVYAGAKWQLNF